MYDFVLFFKTQSHVQFVIKKDRQNPLTVILINYSTVTCYVATKISADL